MIQVPTVTFDAADHTYRIGKEIIRSVTQVLESAGISDFSGVAPNVLAAAQERGTMVHRACHYLNQHNLDPASVDERIAGYVEAWKACKRDHHFNIRHSEHVVYRRITIRDTEVIFPDASDLSIVGTLDAEGLFGHTGQIVNDLKTGEETDAWGPQLAAYVRAFSATARYTHKRLVTQLRSNGTYKLRWFPIRYFERDWEVFRVALIESKRIQREG